MLAVIITTLAAFGAVALLVNIFERKQEARNPFYRVVELTDTTEDPGTWGKNFPLQYDGYLRTVDQVRTRFGGSEAIPRTPTQVDPRSMVAQSRLEADPRSPGPGDRPLALRYGQVVLKQPVVIPGKAQALGMWVKGNAGWGRFAHQLHDAKGELWTSIGTSNDWNCDDPYGWSRVNFDGWRYLRFPLPGNRPFDAARELESTWWN